MKRGAKAAAAVLLAVLARAASAGDWVLAASAFTVSGSVSGAAKTAATLLPQEILDLFSNGIERSILPDETEARVLHELRVRRQALFLELSAAVKSRDKIVLEKPSSAQKKSLKDAEKKVADAKEKLQENAVEYDRRMAALKKESVHSETVVLWKGDNTALYTPPGDKLLDAALDAEKINGLITGEILTMDDYAVVMANLHVVFGAGQTVAATEVGRLTESAEIARRLVWTLFSELVRTQPVRIGFDIKPAELSGLQINIDDMTFTSAPETVILHAGIHSVSIAAQGYRTESFSLNFEESKSYVIHVEMSEATLEKVTLAMKEPAPGFFFINAEKMEESQSGAIVIETKSRPILGRFDFVGGHSQYFYIPQVISRRTGLPEEIQPADWAVNPKNRDAAARIELSRKIMYASYTAMMVSLPLLFFAMGEYQLRANAVMGGLVPYDKRVELYDEARTWYTIQNVCIGVSATLGVNFLTQLIIYLVRANATLPERARIK